MQICPTFNFHLSMLHFFAKKTLYESYIGDFSCNSTKSALYWEFCVNNMNGLIGVSIVALRRSKASLLAIYQSLQVALMY